MIPGYSWARGSGGEDVVRHGGAGVGRGGVVHEGGGYLCLHDLARCHLHGDAKAGRGGPGRGARRGWQLRRGDWPGREGDGDGDGGGGGGGAGVDCDVGRAPGGSAAGDDVVGGDNDRSDGHDGPPVSALLNHHHPLHAPRLARLHHQAPRQAPHVAPGLGDEADAGDLGHRALGRLGGEGERPRLLYLSHGHCQGILGMEGYIGAEGDRATLVGDRFGLGLPSHCIVTVLGELAPLVGLELGMGQGKTL